MNGRIYWEQVNSATGLDYAVNRYEQPGYGRFLSPDPYKASAGLADPGSWNRYAYTSGDPVNRIDELGLADGDATVGGIANFSADSLLSIVNVVGATGYNWITFPGGTSPNPVPGVCGTDGEKGGDCTRLIPDPPTAPLTCGENPVTGTPGIIPNASGQPGELRPGYGGNGEFDLTGKDRGRAHRGEDVAGVVGAAIHSVLGGTVTFAGQEICKPNEEPLSCGYGNYVIVDVGHGIQVLYAHLESINVQLGQVLGEGDTLGLLGMTGNANGLPATEAHVHIEARSHLRNTSFFSGQPFNINNILNNVCPW